MAVGDESIGFGATCEIDDGGNGAASGAAYTEVDMIVTLGVPSEKTNIVESKRLDLPGGVIRKLAALKDGGEFTIKQQFTNAGFARMEALRNTHQEDKTYNLFKITVPDDDGDTEVIVRGIVTENKTDGLEAEKITEFETMVTVQGANV